MRQTLQVHCPIGSDICSQEWARSAHPTCSGERAAPSQVAHLLKGSAGIRRRNGWKPLHVEYGMTPLASFAASGLDGTLHSPGQNGDTELSLFLLLFSRSSGPFWASAFVSLSPSQFRLTTGSFWRFSSLPMVSKTALAPVPRVLRPASLCGSRQFQPPSRHQPLNVLRRSQIPNSTDYYV